MKAIFLALFVVAVTAAPLPEEASGGDAVEMIVNGVPEGAALDVGDILDIKLKEHSEGTVVATDLLHPYSAAGIAEAAAAAAAAEVAAAAAAAEVAAVPAPNELSADMAELEVPIVISPPGSVPEGPSPVIPEPEGPSPVIPEPEGPSPVIPGPEGPSPVIPEPVVLPPPAAPEVIIAEQEQLPIPAPQISSQLHNDGLVQVQYNGPAEPGLLSTLQDWFQVVVNYFTPASGAPAAAGPDPRHHIH